MSPTPTPTPAFDPTAPIVPPVRRPVRRRLAAAAVVTSLALVGVAGVVVGAADESASSGLRTAEVGRQEVVETLDVTGTVSPVAEASVAFPTDGTVASVDVAVGDQVEVGQQLATLDTSDLEDAIVAAEEALAVAQLSLEQALDGEAVTESTSDTGVTGSSSGEQPTAVGDGSVLSAEVLPVESTTASGVTDEEIADAQQAVLDATDAAEEALATADASLSLATDVCAALGTEDASSTVAEDCQAALTQVVTDQQAASDALDARSEAADALDALLAERASEEESSSEESPSSSTTTTTPSTPTDDGAEGADGGVGGTGDTGATGAAPSGDESATVPSDSAEGVDTTASSEELIAYQSDVDAAAAQLLVAEQALDQATIVSPLAGTVASVELAVGDEVTAGSSTATVVIVGDGGYEITTTVTVDDLADLEVGQSATVAVDGVDEPLTGEVVAIGLTSTEGDSGRVYPVTIALTSSADLRNGTLADVSIELTTSTESVAVPTSAIDMSGDRATVTVLDDDGETSTVAVELGAVGGAYVEVTGVDVGTVVVLADLSEPLPESDDSSSSSGSDDSLPAGAPAMSAAG